MKVAQSGDDDAMLSGERSALGFGRVEGYEAPSWPNTNGSKQFHLDPAGHPFCLTDASNW